MTEFFLRGARIVESVHMTESRAHPLSSCRILARIAGGSWKCRPPVQEPMRKALLLADGSVVMHPVMVAELRKAVP